MKIRVGRGLEVVVGIVVYIVVGGGIVCFRDSRGSCGSCVVVLLFEYSK